jgi:tRNA(fMet)-specific endonuclease VapC
MESISPSERATSIVTFEEELRGWLAAIAKARTQVQEITAYRRLKRILVDFTEVQVLDYDELAATEFQRLKAVRVRIGTMDLKIAAIALAHDATLLSRNLADFRRVPGLKVEDWTSA